MKKINLLFLISIIIFACFMAISLAKSNPPTPSARQNTVTAAPTIPTKSNACIITVNGQKYDVTQYRLQHSGGNIFTCGTDMSATFTSQHSQRYLNMMQSYLVP